MLTGLRILPMTASPFLTQKDSSTYEADYLAWIAATVQHLKQGNYDRVDWENLIDEIEDIGRSEKQKLFWQRLMPAP
jgi:hypothetical protein